MAPKPIQDTEPVVQQTCIGRTSKGVWVVARLPAGGGLCVAAPSHLIFLRFLLYGQ